MEQIGDPAGIGRQPSKDSVRSQLARVLASPDFDTSERSRGFLRFVVECALTGRHQEISQQAIASEVFGRSEDFDPTTDPIVRIQAGRVRRSLERYYLKSGRADPILITIPKGAYVPCFSFAPAPTEVSPAVLTGTAGDAGSWPTLLVAPLRNLTGRSEVGYIAEGVASDLAAELSRYTDTHVFLSAEPADSASEGCPARFKLKGTVAFREDDLKISLHLVETDTGRQPWAQTYSCPAGPDQGSALDKVVQTTVAMLAEEQGILSRRLREDLPQPSRPVGTAYEAILRYHQFALIKEPQGFDDALAALRQAVKADPDCALCWSYLARLGAVHWSLGVSGDAIPIEDSMAAARRGAGLAPFDVRSRVLLAFVLLVADEPDQARNEANAAFELSGMSTFYLDAVGYLLTLLGAWDRGPALVRKAVQINPFPRRACYSALWLDAIRRGDPASALASAREYAPEVCFWGPLMEAVALVDNDRADEAAMAVERLLQTRPDFRERGHWLITRYVKFDELVDHIETALAKVGVAVSSHPEEARIPGP